MPSTEGKHELAKSWERSETGLHPPNLVNQKNSYNSCSSDERRNWFYGCLSSMDSTSTEVESSLDLNVLRSKMRNNLTSGMDTQINNSILYPYLQNRLWSHVWWLPGILILQSVISKYDWLTESTSLRRKTPKSLGKPEQMEIPNRFSDPRDFSFL